MPKTYSLGLTITAPVKGDTNYAPVEDAKNTRISQHDHSGGGMGTQIGTSALASDSVNATKIRLGNNTSLRARNVADSADVNLFKLGTDNVMQILAPLRFASTETLTVNGVVSTSTHLTILNGTSLAMTLAAGTEGQLKWVVNIASTTATVTPASTSGANIASLVQYGVALYIYLSSEWRLFAGTGCTATDDIQATTAASGTYTVTGRIFTFNNAGVTTATFNAGVAGQRVTVYNIGAGTVTLTLTGRPAATDIATIVTGGSLELVMINSLWQPFVGVGTTLA